MTRTKQATPGNLLHPHHPCAGTPDTSRLAHNNVTACGTEDRPACTSAPESAHSVPVLLVGVEVVGRTNRDGEDLGGEHEPIPKPGSGRRVIG